MSPSALSHRWQTTIADLALILFLLAATALDRAPAAGSTPPAGIALTLWRDEPGALPLADWLAEQAPDTAHRLSITVTYAPGGMVSALARIAALRAAAGPAADTARITIIPGAADSVQVQLVQEGAIGPDLAE